MLKINATVVECDERTYQDNKYYVLLVNSTEEGNEFPMGQVSSTKPYSVGSTIYLTLNRDKEFKLKVRVAKE